MKRLFGLTMILTLVFPLATWSLLYDFEDPAQLDDWTLIQGTWSIIDGELDGRGPQAGQPGVMIVLSDNTWNDEWKDYTIEFDAKILEDSEDAGIVFRWQNADPADLRYHLYRIDNWPRGFGQKQAEGWVADEDGGAREMMGQTKVDIEPDIWYKFRVEVVGSNFKCYLDDELMFELDANGYSWGKIGFRMWNSHARYDNLSITGPGIPGAAVEPSGKLTATWGQIKVHH
ncbi:family 16 glycoside hydrolase [Candidatus Poribacteria bacterium]